MVEINTNKILSNSMEGTSITMISSTGVSRGGKDRGPLTTLNYVYMGPALKYPSTSWLP